MVYKRRIIDARELDVQGEVVSYRRQYDKLIKEYNASGITTVDASYEKFNELFALIEKWPVVQSDLTQFQGTKNIVKETTDFSTLEKQISNAFDEIRRQFIEFNWFTLKYYVKKRLQQKGFPITEPHVKESEDLTKSDCSTSGNPLVKSLQFNNPYRDMFPNPKQITCTVIFNIDRSSKIHKIENYEDLEDVLNTQIHPDAEFEPAASAPHWTALTRLIDLLENHYV